MTDQTVFSDATQAAGTGESMIELVDVDKYFGESTCGSASKRSSW